MIVYSYEKLLADRVEIKKPLHHSSLCARGVQVCMLVLRFHVKVAGYLHRLERHIVRSPQVWRLSLKIVILSTPKDIPDQLQCQGGALSSTWL